MSRSVSFADRQKSHESATKVDEVVTTDDADDSDYMYDSDESNGSGMHMRVKQLLKEVHVRESRLYLREKQQNDAREEELNKRDRVLDQREDNMDRLEALDRLDRLVKRPSGTRRPTLTVCMMLSNIAVIIFMLWCRTELCRCV